MGIAKAQGLQYVHAKARGLQYGKVYLWQRGLQHGHGWLSCEWLSKA